MLVALMMDEASDKTPNEHYKTKAAESSGDSKRWTRHPTDKVAAQGAADIAAISSTPFRLMMKSLWRF